MTPEIPGLGGFEQVGRGGFGTVYRVRDDRFDRTVAVKVMHETSFGADALARFDRECRASGLLSTHPNIVAVYDSGQAADGSMYMVMEYLSGGSLAARLKGGPLPVAEVLTLGVDLAGALETAHRVGVIHRDVKPENVLYSEFGSAKLVDFGLARMKSAYETRSGSISATLSHAPPEIIAGSATTESADVYSLASVLFTMLTGSPPFDRAGEDSLTPLIARISTQAPPDMRALGVPPEIVAVIERGLAKDPADRYPSAASLGEALVGAAAQLGTAVGPVPLRQIDPLPPLSEVALSATPRSTTVEVGRAHAVTALPVDEAPADGLRRRRIATAGVMAAAIIVAGVAVALWPDDSGVGIVEIASSATTTTSIVAETTLPPTTTAASPALDPSSVVAGATTVPSSTGLASGSIGRPAGSTGSTRASGSVPPGGATNASPQPATGNGGGGEVVDRPVVTDAPVVVPGSPRNVTVANPSGDNNLVAVQVSWGSPSGGGAPTHYRIRRQERWADGCGQQNSVGGYEDVGAEPGTSAIRQTSTPRQCSWIVWQVAAENNAGISQYVDATGVVPDVRGAEWPYHLVRAVGGRATGRADEQCGVAAYTGCSTTRGGGARIIPGSDVGVTLQAP